MPVILAALLLALAQASAGSVRPDSAFDAEYARLKQGRVYAKQVPTETLRKRHGAFNYWLAIPETYDPAKKYQVRFHLHGGVMREDASLRGDGTVRLPGSEQIHIAPAGWSEAPWWSDAQVKNLRGILDSVKTEYNVDENRVVISGVSDGGTGAYYIAMRDTTPYASFLPLNGYVLVLRSPHLAIPGDVFLNNLRNKPLFIVNGGKDPLYPIDAVEPSIVQMHQGGVPIVYRPQVQAGHDTSWWPALKDDFDGFVRTHPREPLPDTSDFLRLRSSPHSQRQRTLNVRQPASQKMLRADRRLLDCQSTRCAHSSRSMKSPPSWAGISREGRTRNNCSRNASTATARTSSGFATSRSAAVLLQFYTATGRWRCTDVGTRVVVAIRLDTCDSSWYSGPPYSVSESVFDEYDVEGCSLEADVVHAPPESRPKA